MKTHEGSDDLLVVVVREEPLADGDEEPEGVLLAAEDQEDGRDDVHGLAVADGGVAERVGVEDAAKGADAVSVLEGGVLRHGTVEVALDLVVGEGLQLGGGGHHDGVVAGVGDFLVDGAGGVQPDLGAKSRTRSK